LEKAKIKIQKMIFEVLFLDYIYTTKKKERKENRLLDFRVSLHGIVDIVHLWNE